MLTKDHILIHPYNSDGERHFSTTDPNCYCTCKEWQLQDAIRYSKSQRQMLHILHLIDILHDEIIASREEMERRFPYKLFYEKKM